MPEFRRHESATVLPRGTSTTLCSKGWKWRERSENVHSGGRLVPDPCPLKKKGNCMSRQFLYVLTDAAPGFDKEFNEWYDSQHLPEVLEIPGFVAATRYRQERSVGLPDSAGRIESEYLATYEIVGDPTAPIQELIARRSDGSIQMPPFILPSRRLGVFSELSGA